MKDISSAAKDLVDFLDHPPWLNAIVVGSEGGRPTIFVYLSSHPSAPVPVLEDGEWEGYPLISRHFGSFAPMGSC